MIPLKKFPRPEGQLNSAHQALLAELQDRADADGLLPLDEVRDLPHAATGLPALQRQYFILLGPAHLAVARALHLALQQEMLNNRWRTERNGTPDWSLRERVAAAFPQVVERVASPALPRAVVAKEVEGAPEVKPSRKVAEPAATVRTVVEKPVVAPVVAALPPASPSSTEKKLPPPRLSKADYTVLLARALQTERISPQVHSLMTLLACVEARGGTIGMVEASAELGCSYHAIVHHVSSSEGGHRAASGKHAHMFHVDRSRTPMLLSLSAEGVEQLRRVDGLIAKYAVSRIAAAEK